jgi:RNA polymerase sigma-70 factor (ECF subfamily)
MGPKIIGSSDDALVELLRRGDEQAFASLYRDHQARLYRFAFHMSHSHSIAEETTQETFLTLIRQPERYDPARGNVAAFLFGVARNHVLRALERDRRFEPLEADQSQAGVGSNGHSAADLRAVEEHDDADGAGALAQLERQDRVESVRRAVLSLPPVYREVVVLCDLEQCSYADAAARLECPVGTVRSRLNRARGLLLAKLGSRNASDASADSPVGEPARPRRMRAGGRV